jgi:CubicO group peptidase (beta-lactamase class C family)
MGRTGLSRNVQFPPGAGYSYSPSGYVYTQRVLEEVSGSSLEELAQELVFQPLGMAQSSFIATPAVMAQPARGHMPALLPALVFAVPFLVVLGVLALVALVVGRLRAGRWRISRRTALAIYGLAALPACALSFALTGGLFGGPSTTYGLLILVLWGTPLAALLLADAVLKRRLPERPRLRRVLRTGWMLVVVAVVAGATLAMGDLPGVTSEAARSDAAASVRATAADLARFAIEIANPQHLSAESAAQMRTPQVALRSDLSWGLGPGIQHSPAGDALWHGGQELDFQSVMIIYPDLGYGAVVLTNSDLLNAGVAIDIAHRALGGHVDAIRCAALSQELNYQGP